MANDDIISLSQAVIPTVVSYDPQSKSLRIGEAAKMDGIRNTTNMFNFKMDLFLGEKEFANKKKYWYGVSYSKDSYEHNTFSAREVTGFFISELLKDMDLPPRLIIGEPAVRENNLKENFRKNIRDVFADIGQKNIDLFFEPFAVFQYYRHYENYFPVTDKSEIILVIDIGGGTFNSCIIATTNEGKLSRSGSNMLPLGLQGEQCGGARIDIELAKLLIEKCQRKGIKWKDNPVDRLKPPVLFAMEEAKIFLSNKIGPKAPLASNYDRYAYRVVMPENVFHPEIEITEELTGDDLKAVIRNMWRHEYGRIITKTVVEAEQKLKKKIDAIDKVIIAGGSSKLPFMREEVFTVLPTLVKKSDIYIGNDLGNAVACGIACECKELVRSKKYPDLTVGTIAPCLLKDLYIGFKVERRGRLILPKVNSKECNGMLFSSPFEISKVTKSFTLEIPIDIQDKLYFFFDDKPLDNDEPTYLNISDFVISIPVAGKVTRKFNLDLEIRENGSVVPTFILQGKGSEAKKAVKPVTCREFYLDNSNIIEGEGFLGIDFGTSNSYVAKFLSPKHAESGTQEYPSFILSHTLHEKLRQNLVEIRKYEEERKLERKIVLEHAKSKRLLMIFHSNKIEGNTLSHGETESVIDGDRPDSPSKSQLEAINLDDAFSWVLDNFDSAITSPEAFIRHINGQIMRGIKSTAGEYRKGPVKLTGMDYVPPPSIVVPSYMRQLAEEISQGAGDRSPVEFAASIHTKLVMIHPFEDGNGRTARLFMNAVLLKYNLPMVIINFADKKRYFDGIEKANGGDITEFLNYIFDCLEPELEEIIKNVVIDEKESISDVEQKRDNVPKKMPFGEKFVALLEKKLEDKLKDNEEEYKCWAGRYDNLKFDIKNLIKDFNASEYTQLGYQMRITEFDQLSLEKFNDISKAKNVPRTWFFRIEISKERITEKILFFFQHASAQLKGHEGIIPVSLCLARYDGTTHKRLIYEPIQLHEIGATKERLIFMLQNNMDIAGDNTQIISDYLLYDVVNNYF